MRTGGLRVAQTAVCVQQGPFDLTDSVHAGGVPVAPLVPGDVLTNDDRPATPWAIADELRFQSLSPFTLSGLPMPSYSLTQGRVRRSLPVGDLIARLQPAADELHGSGVELRALGLQEHAGTGSVAYTSLHLHKRCAPEEGRMPL